MLTYDLYYIISNKHQHMKALKKMWTLIPRCSPLRNPISPLLPVAYS